MGLCVSIGCLSSPDSAEKILGVQSHLVSSQSLVQGKANRYITDQQRLCNITQQVEEMKTGNGRNLKAFPFLQQCPLTPHAFWLVTPFGWDGRKELIFEGYHVHMSP